MSTLHHRGGGSSEGLSPEAQQMLIYLGLACLGAFLLVKVVYMMLYSLPIVALALFFTKPSLYGFRDFLSLVDKKDIAGEDDDTTSGGGGAWLASLVAKGLKGLKGAIMNPAHSWVYLDLLLLIVAKKKGHRKYALGVLNRWFLLEETSDVPMLAYAFLGADMVVGWLGEEHWLPFTSLPPPPGGGGGSLPPPPSIDPSRLLNAANELLSGELDAMAARVGTPQSSSSRPTSMSRQQSAGGGGDGGRRLGDRPIKAYLDRAQALAEGGRFEQAGQVVEQGLARCRSTLRPGGEEEAELWLVAAAFYEASGSSCLTSLVKCVREAAALCVSMEKWSKAAQLYEQAADVWIKEKLAGSNYGIIATSKASSLVLAAVLCTVMFGDTVKADEVLRRARTRDTGVPDTPEGELASSVLTACSRFDSKLVLEARASYLRCQGTTPLEQWQEAAIQQITKRLDSGHLS